MKIENPKTKIGKGKRGKNGKKKKEPREVSS